MSRIGRAAGIRTDSNLIKSLRRSGGPVRDPPKEGLMPNVEFTALEHQLFNRQNF
jgi:hypothetical protein